MWTVLGLLIFFILLQIVDRRYKNFQQQDPEGIRRVFAVGKQEQPLWRSWLMVSGAAIGGFTGGTALGLNGVYGFLAVVLPTILYLERMRSPKLLIVIGPDRTQVAFENLLSTVIDINEKSEFIFDGKRLVLQERGGRKQMVLSCQEFPTVNFPAFWQWLTDVQGGRVSHAREQMATLSGFRAPEGISDLLFLREEKTHRSLALLLWAVILLLSMKWAVE